MPLSPQQQATLKNLFSPWVMRAAWNKVKHWYGLGEFYDTAEFLEWEANPWYHLSTLAADLSSGRYAPAPFPMIPYPKKGDRTRHYVVPSVRDQVAFMAYMVLVGPFLEAQMPHVSFGSRLHRPKVRHTDGKWYRLPFALNQGRVYDGFTAGYGLFRRISQWITSGAVLGAENDDANRAIQDDPRRLPYVSDPKPKGDLAYSRLDLSLAYPSVKREALAVVLVEMMKESSELSEGPAKRWGRPDFPSLRNEDLEEPFASWVEQPRQLGDEKVAGQPWELLAGNEAARILVAQQLAEQLKMVRYARWEEPPAWEDDRIDLDLPWHHRKKQLEATDNPEVSRHFDTYGIWPVECHLDQETLQSDRFGLPTGLAVSGLLLNVALTRVDLAMCQLYDQASSPEGRVFYLRFVDDVILFAASQATLETGIQRFRDALKSSGHSFVIGQTKAEPDSVKHYLKGLTSYEAGHRKTKPRLRLKPGDFLTRANVFSFNTAVVQEMSHLADVTIEETFGAPGIMRLNQLLALAGREDEDPEVETSARLSFAVRNSVMNLWPEQPIMDEGKVVDETEYVRRVLLTAEKALRDHPWRFKLWKPILVAALRAAAYDEEMAVTWLKKHVLALIRWDSPNQSLSDRPWEHLDKAEERSDTSKMPSAAVLARRHHHKRLRTSFHRAWFWRQWTECAIWLRRIAYEQVTVSPGHWLFRITRAQAVKALRWFGNLPAWAGVLYGKHTPNYWPDGRPFLWWWEAESLRHAVLVSLRPSQEVLAYLGGPTPNRFRTPAFRPPGIDHVLPLSAPQVGPVRVALDTVLGYHGLAESADAHVGNPKLAVLWVPFCKVDGNGRRLAFAPANLQGVAPESGTDTLEWAAVARCGLWPHWSRLADLKISETPPHTQSKEWGAAFELLDAYAVLRRLLLAHGQRVLWRTFAPWFADIRSERRVHGTPKTLLHAMYKIANDEEQRDAYVPALEMPSQASYHLVRSALDRVLADGSGIITPDTVHPQNTAHKAIVEGREAIRTAGTGNVGEKEIHEQITGSFASLLRVRKERLIAKVTELSWSRRAPHPLFLLPEVLLRIREPEAAERWRAGALLVWLLTGGEAELDRIFEMAPWQRPLSEREDLRNRLALKDEIWEFLEFTLASAPAKYRRPFKEFSLPELPRYDSRDAEHRTKIKDIVFMQGDWRPIDPGDDSSERKNGLMKELRVRLVQSVGQPLPDIYEWAQQMSRLSPAFDVTWYAAIGEELADRLNETRQQGLLRTKNREADHLMLFPEWYVPYEWVPMLQRFVAETGVAVLSGILVRELPRAVPVVPRLRRAGLRMLVNEAVLILPKPVIQQDEESAGTYTFFIRKPFPNANELGLVKHLQALTDERKHRSTWSFASGHTWYRWTYPRWGSFSVAICSDLVDTFIWNWLRGRIQHLFIPAWNPDVDLFDQLSWTRGYELYSNVVTVNHGSEGGSLAWTPKHNHDKELFRVHGPNKGLAVRVELPVAKLIEAQKMQLQKSIDSAASGWVIKTEEEKKKEADKANRFKTPAPNYRWKR